MHVLKLNDILYFAEKKPDCELEIAHSLRYESTNSVLFFASPTVDDTGEMLCNSTSNSNSRGRSIYIAVGKVFCSILMYSTVHAV